MRYLSLLFALAIIAALVVWYMKTNPTSVSGTEATPAGTPKEIVKQAEDTAKALQDTLQKQQQQVEQAK